MIETLSNFENVSSVKDGDAVVPLMVHKTKLKHKYGLKEYLTKQTGKFQI